MRSVRSITTWLEILGVHIALCDDVTVSVQLSKACATLRWASSLGRMVMRGALWKDVGPNACAYVLRLSHSRIAHFHRTYKLTSTLIA